MGTQPTATLVEVLEGLGSAETISQGSTLYVRLPDGLYLRLMGVERGPEDGVVFDVADVRTAQRLLRT